MAETPNHEYNVPDQGQQDWHVPLNDNFEAFEVDIELRDQEGNLSSYTPTEGAKFLATDTGVVYVGDGSDWVPQFVLAAYDPSAGEATITPTLVTTKLDLETLSGPLTGGTELTSIAGNNLSIDSNGQLNAAGGGGGGGGNWTENANFLEPTDTSVLGIDVDQVDTDELAGSLTGGTPLSTIAGTNLSIDSNGQLNASTGGGGGGISSLNGGDGIDPSSIGNGDTLSVAWGDGIDLDADGSVNDWSGAADLDSSGGINDWSGAADLDSSGAVDTISGSVTGGTTLSDLTGTNLSIDSNGRLNATTSGGGISGLSGGNGINPDSIDDGDTVSVAWGDASGLGSNGEITGGNWTVNSNDLLEPADSNVSGVDLSLVRTSTINAETNALRLKRAGNRVLELQAESGDDAGNVITGHSTNSVGSVVGATISGGGKDGDENKVEADYGTVSGGKRNRALGENSTVSGGSNNKADGKNSVVGGGEGNDITAEDGTIGGGNGNTISSDRATIAGGLNHTITSNTGAIGGGFNNTISSQWGTIAGGKNNTVDGNTAVIGGGEQNRAKGWYSTVAGGAPTDSNNVSGTRNIAADDYCTVGGGGNNRAGSDDGNITNATFATVSGGEGSRASAQHSTVGGGENNKATGERAVVAGGQANEASGIEASITGGTSNDATGNRSIVGGGANNDSGGFDATIAGGIQNETSAGQTAIAGGAGNEASTINAAVGGGADNVASGEASAVPGGQENTASGNYSFAAGRNAAANNDGAFVVGDSTSNSVSSTAADQAVFQQELVSRNTIKAGVSYKFSDFPNISIEPFVPNFGEPELVLASGSGGGNVSVVPGGTLSAGGRIQTFGDDNGVAANFSGDVIIGNLQSDTGSNVVINSNDELAVESSSARHKTNIQPHATSGGVLDLQLHSFEYEDTGSEDVGLIAEEVEDNVPEIVTYDDEDQPYGVKYDRVGLHLVPEVRENRERLGDIETDRADTDDRIAELEAELETKDARLADQRDRIDRLESRVQRETDTVDALRDELETKDERIENLEAENEQLRERLTAIEERLDDIDG